MVNERLGVDLKLIDNDIVLDAQNNFVLISGENNLAQAIFGVLSTKFGELNLHPNYGANLKELIGNRNDDLIIEHARLIITEALLREPRIDTIDEIKVEIDENSIDRLNIGIRVTPKFQDDPLILVYPLFLNI